MAELNFYWRMGDYALEACPKRLARFSDDELNVTINLVKYYQYKGKECKYSIGYFWYNDTTKTHTWQYWYEDISSDYGDYGWMEWDSSEQQWYIEVSDGEYIELPSKYDTSNLWHVE